jgi:large subunit ribosomal protein LX
LLNEKGEIMKAFRVKGMFFMGDRWQGFTKEVIGEDENNVTEQVYSRLGSKHRVKRAKIQISEVTQIKEEEIIDPIILYNLKNVKGEKDE